MKLVAQPRLPDCQGRTGPSRRVITMTEAGSNFSFGMNLRFRGRSPLFFVRVARRSWLGPHEQEQDWTGLDWTECMTTALFAHCAAARMEFHPLPHAQLPIRHRREPDGQLDRRNTSIVGNTASLFDPNAYTRSKEPDAFAYGAHVPRNPEIASICGAMKPSSDRLGSNLGLILIALSQVLYIVR